MRSHRHTISLQDRSSRGKRKIVNRLRVGPDRVLLRATPAIRVSIELTLHLDHRLEEQTVWLALVLVGQCDRALEREPVDVFGHTEEKTERGSVQILPENRQSRKKERKKERGELTNSPQQMQMQHPRCHLGRVRVRCPRRAFELDLVAAGFFGERSRVLDPLVPGSLDTQESGGERQGKGG